MGQSGRAPCGAVVQPSGQPVTQGGGGQTGQGQVIRVATGQVVRLDVEGLELLAMRPVVEVGESPSVVAEPGQRSVVSGEPAGGAGSSAGQPAGPEQSSGQGVQVGRERPDETAARTPAVESQGQGSARGEVRSGGPDGGGDSDRPEQAGQRQDSSARPHSPVGNTAGRLAELIRGAAAGEMLEQDGASVKRLEQSGVRAERGDAAGLIESRAGQQSWAAGRASAEVRGEPLARVDRPGSGEPVQQGRLTEQIVRVVRASLGQMRSQVHLRLSPPELGTLRLEIDLRADALRMRVVTETDAAGKALISRLEQLREALQQHSIRLERVEFEPRRPGADSAARPQDRPALAYEGQQGGSSGQTARGWSSMWDEPEGLEYAAQSAVPEANELSAAVESLVDVVV
ncbi:MAG: flagellar hook-length control protein FliK [Phycisphaerae bacterium]